MYDTDCGDGFTGVYLPPDAGCRHERYINHISITRLKNQGSLVNPSCTGVPSKS